MKTLLLPIIALATSITAQSLTEVLSSNTNTSSLALIVTQTTAVFDLLSNQTNVTILAPNNEAIAAFLATEDGAKFSSDADFATAVLSYHILPDIYNASDFIQLAGGDGEQYYTTLLTSSTYANVTDGQNVGISGANGSVLVSGGLSRNANVVVSDISFDGGLLHVIDTVLTVPKNINTTLIAADLQSLAGALVKTDQADPVQALGDITLIAPNNQAFQNIGSVLSNMATDQLTDVLEYHVVDGVIFQIDIQYVPSVTTLRGENITFSVEGDDYFVNGARIILPDVLIANGVIHIVDNVLNPSNATASPTPSATAGECQFSRASAVTTFPFTQGIPTTSASNFSITTTFGGPVVTSSSTGSMNITLTAAATAMDTAVGMDTSVVIPTSVNSATAMATSVDTTAAMSTSTDIDTDTDTEMATDMATATPTDVATATDVTADTDTSTETATGAMSTNTDIATGTNAATSDSTSSGMVSMFTGAAIPAVGKTRDMLLGILAALAVSFVA